MYPFTKYLKELNNEPKKDDGSDANDEVRNKLAKTVNAVDPVGRLDVFPSNAGRTHLVRTNRE